MVISSLTPHLTGFSSWVGRRQRDPGSLEMRLNVWWGRRLPWRKTGKITSEEAQERNLETFSSEGTLFSPLSFSEYWKNRRLIRRHGAKKSSTFESLVNLTTEEINTAVNPPMSPDDLLILIHIYCFTIATRNILAPLSLYLFLNFIYFYFFGHST